MLEENKHAGYKADDRSAGSEKRTHLTSNSINPSGPMDNLQTTRTAIVVVGMHRSGTSAISRVLNLLGADMPKKLLPPRSSNPAGFWESKDVMTLHDKMLSGAGTSWDDPGYLPTFWNSREYLEIYQKKFAEIIERELGDSNLFVLKDPRISRFVPLTVSALKQIGISPKFVIALRNPLEVAASLKKRDGFHLAKSLLLWLDHSLRAEKMTRNFPRSFVLYEEMLTDWRSSFRAVAEDLELIFPAWSTRNDVLIESFVSSRLRNHSFSLEDTLLHKDVAQWVKASYESLRLLACGESITANKKKLGRIYSEFKRAQKVFGPILAQEQLAVKRITDDRDGIQKKLHEDEIAAEKITQDLERARKESERLSLQYESATEKQELAEKKAVEHVQKIEHLSKHISTLQSEFNALTSKYEVVFKERDHAVEESAERAEEIEQLSKQISTLQSEFNALTSKYEGVLKERDHAVKESGDRAQKVGQLSKQVSTLQSEFDTLTSKYEGVNKEREHAVEESAERAQKVGQLSKQVSTLQSEFDTLTSKYEGVNKEREHAVEESAERAQEADQISKQFSTLRSDFDALRSDHQVLHLEFDSLAAERNELTEKAKRLVADKQKLVQQVSRQADVATVLREKLDLIAEQNHTIRRSRLWRMGAPVRTLSALANRLAENSRVARTFVRLSRTDGLKEACQLLEDRKLLLSSGLFDLSYYTSRNTDALEDFDDPASHYLIHGAEAERDPNLLFDTAWYVEKYPDVLRAGTNPLRHFLMFGAKEKRDPNPLFQTGWYLENNKDVVASGVNPLVHYLMFGGMEGRNPNALFDGKWYLEQNPAVAEAGINPLVHFLKQGWREGRNPSDRFDVCFYLENNPDVANSGVNPLAHYLRIGRAEGRSCMKPTPSQALHYTVIGGKRPRVVGWKTILCVAHFASERLFGAERSFLDILDGLSGFNVNVVAVLPKNISRYTTEVQARCSDVAFFEYHWWKKDSRVSEEVIRKFESVISNHQVDAVHVNTIMVREPLVAASNCGVSSVVHVRELICDDKWLTEAIGEPPHEIVNKVLKRADWIIANSETTRKAFDKKSNTFVVPNPVDLEALDVPNPVDPANVRFGLISSNIKKKGISDLVELSHACADRCPNARFVLVGPETRLIKELRSEQGKGNIPSNIEFAGYADSPRAGIEQVNVVLNLSHFKESFGRTVIEAMAARRPAIAYDWGALPELIVDGVTGFLVPYRQPALAVPAIVELCSNIERIIEMGDASRDRAEQSYSKQYYSEQMLQAYRKILGRTGHPREDAARLTALPPKPVSGADRNGHTTISRPMSSYVGGTASPETSIESRQLDVSVIVPNYNYADYLPERLRSILEQSVLPREIIFIDDVSDDDSVLVARSILEQSGIPFTVEVNETNVGPYANWKKGLSLANGDFVWIAEADDTCERDFLETVMVPAEAAEEVVISYAQSRKIDGAGNTISSDSLAHTDEISSLKWKSSYIELGVREVVDALVYRNTIPNVSACILKRSEALEAAPVLDSYRYCGDWAFYARMLRNGRIAYNHRPLNAFRRHAKSQTRRTFQSADFIVEVAMVRESICRDFPLRLRQFPRMDYFLDKDYPVEDIQCNASHPPVARLIESAATHAKDRKLIAFITTNNGSYTGGSEVLWREAAIALRKAGHDVIVLIKKWDPAPEFFREFEAAGIKLYFKDEDGFANVLAHEPDLTIISTGDQDEGTEYYDECLRRDLKYVIVNQLTKEERFWPIRTEKQDSVRAGYTNASRIFFTCKNNHSVMESRLSCRLENVDYHFNPFHIDRNEVPTWPDGSPKYRLAVPSKLLYIHKGQDLLIEVLKADKWRERSIEVNFYGVGDDREVMEKTVEELSLDNVTFRGRVADISDIWKDNHALLMPSRMEGLPIMLVSAMLSARVPILTDVGGHAELVEHGECGFIAADPDVASIDAAMEQAWAARADWERIGEKARKRVLDFLPDDPVSDFMTKIQRVVQEANSARTEG